LEGWCEGRCGSLGGVSLVGGVCLLIMEKDAVKWREEVQWEEVQSEESRRVGMGAAEVSCRKRRSESGDAGRILAEEC